MTKLSKDAFRLIKNSNDAIEYPHYLVSYSLRSAAHITYLPMHLNNYTNVFSKSYLLIIKIESVFANRRSTIDFFFFHLHPPSRIYFECRVDISHLCRISTYTITLIVLKANFTSVEIEYLALPRLDERRTKLEYVHYRGIFRSSITYTYTCDTERRPVF